MFRSFIYLDEDKLYTYKRQIEGKNSAQLRTVTKKKALGVDAALGSVGVSGAIETSVNGEYQKDISFDYDRLELSLSALDGEDYLIVFLTQNMI